MSQNQGSSFGQGVATAGRVIADLRAIIMTVLGVVAIVAAIYLLKKAKTNTWANATLVVQSLNCNTALPGNCIVSGSFTPTGSTQQISVSSLQITTNNNAPAVNSTWPIQYNTVNPEQVRATGITAAGEKKIAWIVIGVAVGLVSISWLWAWAASRSKIVAQGTAGLEAASLVGRLF